MPMIIFGAEEEINHQDRHGGARDDHQPIANKEKAEHVIDLAKPDTRHDEIKLDEYGSKG